jgi:ribonuclease Z
MKLKKMLLTLLALVILLGSAGWFLQVPISLAIARRVAVARLGTDASASLPDGLHVGLCGAGSPFPDERRSGPCTLVQAGKRLFVFDSGSGAARNIGKMGFNHGKIEAIFLTHFHSDHIDGLGELMLQRWVSASNREPVPVHGPVGVDSVVGGFNQAYGLDKGYRVAHHGDAVMPASGSGGQPMPFTPGADGRVVLLKDADLEITAFTVDHAPVHPAVGYRISYKGRSAVISGDTRKSAAVLREAQGADLLVHEALSVPLVNMLREAATASQRANLFKVFGDIIDYHATPEQAAETARDAKVRFLLLNHIAPPLPMPGLEKAFLGEAPNIYSGPLRVGVDGDFISMPAGSTEVTASRRF